MYNLNQNFDRLELLRFDLRSVLSLLRSLVRVFFLKLAKFCRNLVAASTLLSVPLDYNPDPKGISLPDPSES